MTIRVHVDLCAFGSGQGRVWAGDGSGGWDELSLDGAAGPWQPIATEVANSGRYEWRIPLDTRSTIGAVLRYSLTVGSDTVKSTTPVPFTILGGDALFSDGFDSGDTARWSAAVPWRPSTPSPLQSGRSTSAST